MNASTPSAFLTRILAGLREHGSRPAFITDDATVTYRDAYRILRRLHATLDVKTDDVVAILGGNRPETILAQLAVQLCGARVLHIGASTSLPNKIGMLSASGASVLIIDPKREPDSIRSIIDNLDQTKVLTFGQFELDQENSLAGQSEQDQVYPSTVRAIFPSGGTTGTPKLIAHSEIYEHMAQIFQPHPSGPTKILLVAPLSHLTGNCTALGALLSGDTVVLHEGFNAEAVLRDIEAERINTLSLTPPRLASLLDHSALSDTDLSSIRSLSVGASPLPTNVLRKGLAAFGPVIGQGYGLTEAPMVASISPAELTENEDLLGSVGRIVPGMTARIVDNAGNEVPEGETGEVQVHGIAVMDGYYGQRNLTDAAFCDGWLRTEDTGRFDGDGYLYLLGRSTDVIITGDHGTKVYPSMLEDALTEHPLVRQAAVFGVRDHDIGTDLIHAIIVPFGRERLHVADIANHIRTTLGGEHFVPARVGFAKALPLTAIGKIDKDALRTTEKMRADETRPSTRHS